MSDPNTHLFLIRHGQAVVNVEPIIGGMRGDTGLTVHGVAQVEALRDRLLASGELAADVFYSSTLPRARQTAEIIAPAIGAALVLDDDLQEFRVGDEGDGLHIDEYKRRFGWLDFAESPFTRVDPEGESWARFNLRVGETLDRITREHRGQRIVCVTHGGVIEASFQHFFHLHAHAVPVAQLATSNTSITYWRHERRDNRWLWRLVRYNDDHHLRGLTTASS